LHCEYEHPIYKPMSLTKQIATHLREVHFGGNWTWSNFKEHLTELNWKQATEQVANCNSIATLVYHMNFYLNIVSMRVQGQVLDFKHEDSVAAPQIHSDQDWQHLLEKTWSDAEAFAKLIEQLPEQKLWENISSRYGNYYKNIHGVIEHNHYHLGQIVILKKILMEKG